MRPFLLSIFLLIAGTCALKAQSDRELANEYYTANECAKAINHYEKALQETFDKALVRNYVQCLIKEKKWNEGENFFKKQLKKNDPNQTWYYFFWGQLEKGRQNNTEAQKKYEAAIQALALRMDFYTQLIEEFRRQQEPTLAKKVVQKAREVAKNDNILRLEMAGINRDLQDPEAMIAELLDYGAMVRNSEVVQTMLQDFLKEDKEKDLFEKVLYENIQKRPNEAFFNELLIWHLVQKQDFYKAFIQERSLDKRLKNNGARIVELAKLALQNKDYTNAIAMYEYLLKEYPNGQLYSFARRMAIFSREEQVKNTFPVKAAEVEKLIADYEKLLDEIGVNARTLEALRNMAMLHAFYRDDHEKAIELLTTAIEVGKADIPFTDKCKLDLGDIYVLENDPWEASLLYSQVEKSQKDALMGYEAKLRNAKLHYYKGDFELSKSILDILKKATSREIANDANALSLLILDNTGLDSSETAMQEYAAVELLLFQQKYVAAMDTLQQLYVRYKDHSLADEILWLTAQTYMKLDSNQQAAESLQLIVTHFYYDILGDNALYTLASLYADKLKKKEEAMQLFQDLIEKYPGSIYVAEARKRFRQLRGDTIN